MSMIILSITPPTVDDDSSQSVITVECSTMSAEQIIDRGGLDSEQSQTYSLPSTYLSSHLNKTRGAAAFFPQGLTVRVWATVSLTRHIGLCSTKGFLWSWHSSILTCSFKSETLTSSLCHHRYQHCGREREGGRFAFIHAQLLGVEDEGWLLIQMLDSEIKWRGSSLTAE